MQRHKKAKDTLKTKGFDTFVISSAVENGAGGEPATQTEDWRLSEREASEPNLWIRRMPRPDHA